MALKGYEYLKSWERRAFDIAFALGALGMAVPAGVVLVPAAMVASRSLRPFFRQTRVLPGHEPFNILKFQTMPPHRGEAARAISGTVHEEAPPWANRFIRHPGLDELPELAQVLSGKMSVVGPRPIMMETAQTMQREEPALYDEFEALVEYSDNKLKPGIFGLSQLYRRGHAHETGPAASKASLAIDTFYYGYLTSPLNDARIVDRSVAYLTGYDTTPPEKIVEEFVGPLGNLPDLRAPRHPPETPPPEDWRYPLT